MGVYALLALPDLDGRRADFDPPVYLRIIKEIKMDACGYCKSCDRLQCECQYCERILESPGNKYTCELCDHHVCYKCSVDYGKFIFCLTCVKWMNRLAENKTNSKSEPTL